MKPRPSFYLFAAALALSFVSCVHKPAEAKANCCSESVAEVSEVKKTLSDKSLYQVESTWTNDGGNAVVLNEWRGRPQLITMFFASCEFACPILLHDVQRIEDALPQAWRGKVRVTFVSFDTARDTPAALKTFRSAQSIRADWNLLSGNADDVLELAALLGVKYKKDARGQFVHSNIITLLNAEGEIVHQQVGLNQSVDETVRTVGGLALLSSPSAQK